MAEIWPDTFQNPGIFRGGKNDFLEGGVRVPAFAYWPDVIEKGTVVHDMVHVSDLFTTFARLGGKMDAIPTDRVIDGIDQTALRFNGDGHGRRDHVFIYQGPQLVVSECIGWDT
jgi:arylsulfatase